MQGLEHIRHFRAANPGYMTLEGTNQYLLGREAITVIDVALPSPDNIDGILAEAEAMGGKRIEKILLTHIHRDHCGGALALKKRCGAKLGISRLRAGYLGGEDLVYSQGDTIDYDGGRLEVVHTPGHESGHCCFYEPERQILFTGDHILGRGTTVIAPPDGDMVQYLRSLEKLSRLKLYRLFPGHGPVIEDPHGKIREYIEHRLMRERQIMDALREGHRTTASMVEAIYTDTPAPLHSIARRSVEAHLRKLIQEGRVRRDGELYFLNDARP
ncbi:MAG: MBL fold metallo-hydrolase [Deltaproteobacteria bacterium]|nr:MBL fold metallo-hydrolase [Deltaproteobacteria bacterium]